MIYVTVLLLLLSFSYFLLILAPPLHAYNYCIGDISMCIPQVQYALYVCVFVSMHDYPYREKVPFGNSLYWFFSTCTPHGHNILPVETYQETNGCYSLT